MVYLNQEEAVLLKPLLLPGYICTKSLGRKGGPKKTFTIYMPV